MPDENKSNDVKIVIQNVKQAIKEEVSDESSHQYFTFLEPVKLAFAMFIVVLICEISAALDNPDMINCAYDVFLADTVEIACGLALVVGALICIFKWFRLWVSGVYLIEIFISSLVLKGTLMIPFRGGETGRLAIAMVVGFIFALLAAGLIDTLANWFLGDKK